MTQKELLAELLRLRRENLEIIGIPAAELAALDKIGVVSPPSLTGNSSSEISD